MIDNEDIENFNFDSGQCVDMSNKQLVRAIEVCAKEVFKQIKPFVEPLMLVGTKVFFGAFIKELNSRIDEISRWECKHYGSHDGFDSWHRCIKHDGKRCPIGCKDYDPGGRD